MIWFEIPIVWLIYWPNWLDVIFQLESTSKRVLLMLMKITLQPLARLLLRIKFEAFFYVLIGQRIINCSLYLGSLSKSISE